MKKSKMMVTILCLAVLLTSCNNSTEYVAFYNNKNISTGIFAMYELNDATGEVLRDIAQKTPEQLSDYYNNPPKFFLNQTGGKTVEDRIVEIAKEKVQIHAAVNEHFKELNLQLSPDAENRLEQTKENYKKQKEVYSKNGISESSFTEYYENKEKSMLIFEKLYGKNGANEVPEGDLKNCYDKNFLKITLCSFEYTEKNKDKIKEEAEKFLRHASEENFGEALKHQLDEAKAKSQQNVEEKIVDNKKEKAPEITSDKSTEVNNTKEDKTQANASTKTTTKETTETDTSKEEVVSDVKSSNSDEIKDLEAQFTRVICKNDLNTPNPNTVWDQMIKAKFDEPVLIELKGSKSYVVMLKSSNKENEFNVNRKKIIEYLKLPEFNKFLLNYAKKLNINFNETAIIAFKMSKLN